MHIVLVMINSSTLFKILVRTSRWSSLFVLLFILPTGCGSKKAAHVPGTIEATPLKSQGTQNDGPLFEKIDATKSGLAAAKPMDPDHVRRFLYTSDYAGGGVTTGDVNGDGKPDLFISSGPDQNRLYIQKDDFTFEDITEAAGIEERPVWSAGASMGRHQQ